MPLIKNMSKNRIGAIAMERKIYEHYGLNVTNISRIPTGVGGQTYLVETTNGKYILKGINFNDEYIKKRTP